MSRQGAYCFVRQSPGSQFHMMLSLTPEQHSTHSHSISSPHPRPFPSSHSFPPPCLCLFQIDPILLTTDKATTDRNARTLRELVKQVDNKNCADCKKNGEWITHRFRVELIGLIDGVERS